MVGVVAAVALLVTTAGALAPTQRAVAAERIETGRAEVQIRVVGAFDDKPGSALRADSLASSADGDAAVAAVLSDLQDFWALELSTDDGPGLAAPAGGYVSMDSSSTAGGSALCITTPRQITGNAFYCASGDGIVYDSSALVPVLLGSYGSAGLVAAFAHEFGHAVQAQIGPTPADRQGDPERFPAILIEAQADCDAGAFLAWVSGTASRGLGTGPATSRGTGPGMDPGAGSVAGSEAAGEPAADPWAQTRRVRLPAESLVRAVAPLLDFRDPATVSPADPTAHGLGLDRLGFVLTGLRGGAAACPAMTADDLQLTLGREGVTTSPPSTLPRYSSMPDAVAAATASVQAFAGSLGEGAAVQVAPAADPTDLARAGGIGQFAAGAAVALAAGRTIAGSGPDGQLDDGRNAVVAACFTGAWTASVFGHAGVDELGSWPTDADEALDLIRGRPGVTFDELAGYSDGFHLGWSACR